MLLAAQRKVGMLGPPSHQFGTPLGAQVCRESGFRYYLVLRMLLKSNFFKLTSVLVLFTSLSQAAQRCQAL